VAAGVDLVVAVGPDAVGIADGALAAGAREDRDTDKGAVRVPDRAAARQLLTEVLVPGDVVLVKASRSYGLEVLAADLLDTGAGA
jgi:UDP-N-acetylmuramoyl-tripeptide--D-alanyl-D-alanine ligase